VTTTQSPPSAPRSTAQALTRRQLTSLAALAGVVSALATLAVAEVVSLLLGGAGNPLLSVGSALIDLSPPGVKDLVISLFDTADKIFLFGFLGVVLGGLAALAGVLQARKPPAGLIVVAALALVGALAALTRAGAGVASAAPSIAGAIVGALLLRALILRLHAWRRASDRAVTTGAPLSGMERRAFLGMAIATGVASAVVGAGARMMNAAATAVSEIRTAITLPTAASALPAIPADGVLAVDGISPFITPNVDFYRIDTALQVPSIDPAEWVLRIDGMVENPVEITFDELLALPLEENLVTLACVSNEVGGNLIGNALWLGYPIRELLARAKPTAGADMVLSRSQDGFTASTPLEVLQDANTAAILAVGMNGDPLPLEHGFPVRMVVPGLYGYVSATKWVVELNVTTFAKDEGYWTSRGWTAEGPIKMSSRIDTPRRGYPIEAGTVAIAGVAWAQHTGISAVEVRVDDGPWANATLASTVTVDSWLQWSYAWEATPGSHTITVRATDSTGLVQTSAEAPPAPDGSTGLHSIEVEVS
jgi:DMSO/TMAO reductase YedYZ molybdopterin-dependent catalytic subunit